MEHIFKLYPFNSKWITILFLSLSLSIFHFCFMLLMKCTIKCPFRYWRWKIVFELIKTTVLCQHMENGFCWSANKDEINSWVLVHTVRLPCYKLILNFQFSPFNARIECKSNNKLLYESEKEWMWIGNSLSFHSHQHSSVDENIYL